MSEMDERLAKVAGMAELVLGLGDWKADPECRLCRRPQICPIHAGQGIARALKPLLAEWLGEGELRGYMDGRKDGAVEARARVEPFAAALEQMSSNLRLALDGAQS